MNHVLLVVIQIILKFYKKIIFKGKHNKLIGLQKQNTF